MAHTIGGRIAELRRRRGMTQQDLAEAIPLSYSYISLIEADKRNPRRKVVSLIAEQLGCPVDYLLTGRGTSDVRALELDLRFGELALRSGDAASAKERFRSVLDRVAALGDSYEPEALRAWWGLGRCALADGEMRAAAAACEVVAEARELPPELSRPIVLLAVCRSYLECGDVNRAVDVGEAALAEARDDPTFSSDEAGELRATVALCYLERGDLTRASVILDEALRLANAAGSLPARAAALWNKAFVAEANGDARGAELLAESALAAYGETERAVATAILRADLAGLSLRVGNTDYERIERDLVDALGRLRELNAPKMVVAQAAADLARCKLAQGEPVAALTIARDALRECGTEAVIELANLRAVLAEASLELHGDDEAVAGCYRVAEELRRMGRPRRVKAALVSLAEALYRTGRAEDAIVLFRLAVRPYAPDDDAPDRATPYDGAGVTRATAPLDDADARLHR